VPADEMPTGATPADIQKYCSPDLPGSPPGSNDNPNYGLIPQYCATSATNPSWGMQVNGQPVRSFGFCPWWTFCDLGSDSKQPGYPRPSQCTENNPAPAWDTGSKEPARPYCTSADPDARHFCMDASGQINPGSDIDAYYCDPHYDATDYAKDRVDFAGLVNYMDKPGGGKPKPGNFIAMYSIFFKHGQDVNAPLGEDILGVKMLRYIADAGDNGEIDNHLQRWYRDQRDANLLAPPVGINESSVLLPGGLRGPSPKDPPKSGTQKTPPTYDGNDPRWTAAPYTYSEDQDPCAQYDYWQNGTMLTPGSQQYEDNARTSCGQFYFATKDKINRAFTDIASRLFTRLSR
jgi:hypothetical protein